MKIKFATYVSIICHPLITLPLFTIVTFFSTEDVTAASYHSAIIIFFFFFPLTYIMYQKWKNGSYSNFDVSDKGERQSWYKLATLLLIIVTVFFFLTNNPWSVRIPVLLSLILLVCSHFVNYYIKSSLHVSITIFIAFLALPINLHGGLAFLFLAFLVGWSRIILSRHTLEEVLTGSIIGLGIGCLTLVLLY